MACKSIKNAVLETFEWDAPWWEHTENKDSPRVLYIGDSISRGTTPSLNRIAEGKILFDNFSSSKALDNPFLEDSIRLFMRQQIRCDAILVNNGHHGNHLDDEQYEAGYRKLLDLVKEKNKPVYVLLTTYYPAGEEWNSRVIKRNEIAGRLADEYGFEVIDLYSRSEEIPELYLGDKTHFKTEGYDHLAKLILEKINL